MGMVRSTFSFRLSRQPTQAGKLWLVSAYYKVMAVLLAWPGPARPTGTDQLSLCHGKAPPARSQLPETSLLLWFLKPPMGASVAVRQ